MPKKFSMRCTRCGVCCQETEMLLSKEDIDRLEAKGYPKEVFVRYDDSGYAILRNRGGHCVFYNTEKTQCDVYLVRPSGCRVYPVIYDEDKGIITDSICHAHETVTEREKKRKGKIVLKLLEKIDREAANRS
ncbi:MAG: YkgJ family cysteine cluster protein [Candidatus Bathyarchaeota archaeon]|nr:YkgJ family cysteine cluster protein [Candidatus Bathyarchaeota archaeon]